MVHFLLLTYGILQVVSAINNRAPTKMCVPSMIRSPLKDYRIPAFSFCFRNDKKFWYIKMSSAPNPWRWDHGSVLQIVNLGPHSRWKIKPKPTRKYFHHLLHWPFPQEHCYILFNHLLRLLVERNLQIDLEVLTCKDGDSSNFGNLGVFSLHDGA